MKTSLISVMVTCILLKPCLPAAEQQKHDNKTELTEQMSSLTLYTPPKRAFKKDQRIYGVQIITSKNFLDSTHNIVHTRKIMLEIFGKLIQFYCYFLGTNRLFVCDDIIIAKNKLVVLESRAKLNTACKFLASLFLRIIDLELEDPIIPGGFFKREDLRILSTIDITARGLEAFMGSHNQKAVTNETIVQISLLSKYLGYLQAHSLAGCALYSVIQESISEIAYIKKSLIKAIKFL